MGISRDRVHKRRLTGGRFKRLRSKRKFEMGRQPANTKLGDKKKVNKIRVRGGNFKFRALRLDHGNFTWAGEATTRKTRILKVAYNATSNELVRTNTLVKGCIVLIDSTPFKQWYLKYYKIALGKVKAETVTGAKKGAPAKKDVAATAATGKKDTAAAGKKTAATGKKDSAPAKKDTAAAKKEAPAKKDTAAAKKEAPAKKDTTGKKDTAAGKKETAATAKKDTATGKKEAPAGKKDTATKDDAPKPDTKGQSEHVQSKVAKRVKNRVLEDALASQFQTGRLYARLTSSPGQSGRADGVILEGEELAFYLRKIHAKKKK